MHAKVPDEHQALRAQWEASQAALAESRAVQDQLQCALHTAEKRTGHLALLYTALTRCNRAIVQSTHETELFQQICRIAVDSGGLAMAWIGRTDSASGTVRPLASFGDTSGYLDSMQACAPPAAPWGADPSGRAIQAQQPFWQQCLDPTEASPWQTHAAGAGWASAAALPLLQDSETVGALTLYARTAHFFGQDAQQLLVEMASNVSYALDNLARSERQTEINRTLRDNEYAAHLAVENARTALEQLEQQKYALDQHAIVTTVNMKGRITYANDKFCEISGYARSELLGQDHILLNSGVHPKGFFRAMYETLARGDVWHGEICNRAKAGHLFWVQTTVVPVAGLHGKPSKYIAIRTDITQRKAQETELQHYRDHLEQLVQQKTADLQNSVDMTRRALAELERQKYVLDQHAIVTTCGLDGRITYGNEKFSETSGFLPVEFLGRDHSLVNSGHHPPGFFKAMYATIARGGVWHAEVCNRTKNGQLYWMDSTIAAFMGEDGKPREYIAVRTDITERKRGEEAAHAANRAKSEFLANMSHEIRTPMNGMLGMVDVLQATDLAPSQRRILDTIHHSSLALLSILNDILDFSKIEADKLELECIPTQLREVAEGVAQLLVTNTPSAELSVFVSPELPCWVLGDPNRLRQVLLNLLGNALKFTPQREERPARVMLHVEPCPMADGTSWVRLRVVDNGIGMDPQVQAGLFQPFTQADASTARKFGGTGLGLSITQRLVEMMRGRISVHSTLGQGSEFTVELPLTATESARPLPPQPSLEGVLVLAVSTDSHAMLTIAAYCGAAGAHVSTMPDLAAARLRLQQLPWTGPTVVLLDQDVAAPAQGTGLAPSARVVRLVRRSHRTLVNGIERDIRVTARPLLYHDLLHGVALASGRLSAADPAERRHQPQRPQAPSVSAALQAKRLILLAEDNETNREVMREQLQLLGYATEVAEDGAMALEMWRSGRYALLLTDCHMPCMDGFELTQAIRQAEPKGTRLPIIAVTANAMRGEAERCRARGMDDYLSKPLRLKEVGSMLAKWLPLDPQELAPAAVWDADALHRLVGDNPALRQRLLEKFLSNAREQVAALDAAARQGALDTLADVAHPLKSAARSVGALALGELCQALEMAGRAGDAAACCALWQKMPSTFSAAADAIESKRG